METKTAGWRGQQGREGTARTAKEDRFRCSDARTAIPDAQRRRVLRRGVPRLAEADNEF
jgi:hypothetical protein